MSFASTQPIVLIIENEDETRRLYADALHHLNVVILEAANPYEAFDQLRKHRVSVIVTDIHMPGGGIDYLATLRRSVACPILAISGLGDTVRVPALDAGATAFLAKPVSTRELRSAIARLLGGGTGSC